MTVPTQPPDQPTVEPVATVPGSRGRRRRQGWVILGSALVIATGTATTAVLTRIQPSARTGQTATPLATPTATVVRTDLVAQDLETGTLSYGRETTVPAQQQGTLTWLPAPGMVITRGQPLYSVDARPVVLFYSDIPLYRPLGPGPATGPDVRVLLDNLVALGFYHEKPGEQFTPGTAAAVRAWQKSLGLEQTGALAVAQILLGYPTERR